MKQITLSDEDYADLLYRLDYEDAGPIGESWQSSQLENLISEIKKETKEVPNKDKYRVKWTETVHKEYSTIVEAYTEEIAQHLIKEDIDEARTSVIEEDHEEVRGWEITSIEELNE